MKAGTTATASWALEDPASLLSKKELLQEGDQVNLQASQTELPPKEMPTKELSHHVKEAGRVRDRAEGPSQGAKDACHHDKEAGQVFDCAKGPSQGAKEVHHHAKKA